MPKTSEADAAAARLPVLAAFGLTILVSLAFRPWVGASPFFNDPMFWANAAGGAFGLGMRAVLIGGAIWTAVWFIFLRKLKTGPGPTTGWMVIAASLLASMAGWAAGVALASLPSSPQSIAMHGEKLGYEHRSALAYDALAFEREVLPDQTPTAAVVRLVDKRLDEVMDAAGAGAAGARRDLAKARVTLAKHHKIGRARYRQIRDEFEALAAQSSDRAATSAAYRKGFGNVAAASQDYWRLNAEVLDGADAALAVLQNGRWRRGKNGLVGDAASVRRLEAALKPLMANADDLRWKASIVRDPRTTAVSSAKVD